MSRAKLSTRPGARSARKIKPSSPSLLSLPPEIRNLIYKFIPLSNTIHVVAPSKRRSKSPWPATPLSLACTCRALYAEFAPLCYANTKYVTSQNQGYSVALWLEVMERWAGVAITTITFPLIPRCCIVGYRAVNVLEGGKLSGEPESWTRAVERRRERRMIAPEGVSSGPRDGRKMRRRKRKTARKH